MALTIADLLGPLLQRPMMGGPAFGSLLPKSPTNVTGGSPPAPTPPPQSSDAQFLQAMTQMGLAGPQNELHRAQAEQAKALAKFLGTDEPPPAGFGQRGQAGSAPGSMSGPVSMPTGMPPLDTIVPAATQAPDMGGGMRAGGALTGDPASLLGPYAVGNAVPGGASSIEGMKPEFAQRIATMTQAMPPEIRGKFNIISGFRDPERQAQVNPGVTNSRHSHGIAADTTQDPEVISWINQNGPRFGVGYTISHLPGEQNHLEMLGPGGGRAPIGNRPSASPLASVAQVADMGNAAMGRQPMAQAPAFGSISPPGYRSPFSPEDIAWAQRQDQRNAKIGKRNPAMVDEALKMAPGMSGSIEFKAAEERAKRGAVLPFIGPEEAAKRGAGLPFVGPEAAAKAGGEQPYILEQKRTQAELDRETTAQSQRGAASLDMTTLIIGGRRVPATREQAVAAVSGRGVPELGIGPLSGARLGEPVNIGPIPPGQQLTETPSGGSQLADIPGSPQARAESVKAETRQQASDIVTQDIGRALSQSGLLTTGAIGSLTKGVPGIPSYDLRSLLDTVKANVGFDRLQQMREQSPTGGALGNVTETENKLLQSVLGNLDQAQSKGQFEENLRRLHVHYKDAVNGTPAKLATALREGKITQAQHDAAMAERGTYQPTEDAGKATAAAPPAVGAVNQGYRFKGGNPANPASWEKVQ